MPLSSANLVWHHWLVREPAAGTAEFRRSLTRLSTLIWTLAGLLAIGATVGGVALARIAHPVDGASPNLTPTGIMNPPTGTTHPYVTLGIAVVFVGVVLAAAVAAIAWAMHHAMGPGEGGT